MNRVIGLKSVSPLLDLLLIDTHECGWSHLTHEIPMSDGDNSCNMNIFTFLINLKKFILFLLEIVLLLLFICFLLGQSPVVPFIPTYAKQLGFSSVVVGFIYTLLPIMGMIAKPTMGAVADRFKCQKLLFQSSIIVTIVMFFLIMFIPAIPSESNVEVHCHQESVVKICSKNKLDNCLADKVIAESVNNTTSLVQVSYFTCLFC